MGWRGCEVGCRGAGWGEEVGGALGRLGEGKGGRLMALGPREGKRISYFELKGFWEHLEGIFPFWIMTNLK